MCQLQTEPDLRHLVESFVAGAVQPVMLDPGEEPLPLIQDQWSVSEWNGRLVLQAWDRQRNLVRKIVGLKEQRRDRLCLITERFRKAEAELQIADLAAPSRTVNGDAGPPRIAFCEHVSISCSRANGPSGISWRSARTPISKPASRRPMCEPSCGLVRAAWRVAAAPPDAPSHIRKSPAGIVATGLIWLDYLRRREKACPVGRLLLYVPLGLEREVAFRAACLDPAKVACQLFAFDDKDRAGAIDFADAGNIDSTLPPCRRPASPNSEAQVFPEMPDVTRIEQADGSISLQVRGSDSRARRRARSPAELLEERIERAGAPPSETVVAMSREIGRVRDAEGADRQHPLYSLYPEGWLESQVRAHPEIIDASLRSVPIYGQVPVFSGSDGGVIDLLCIDNTGRLVVIEIKATADLQLPFQALDYWLRVRKHLEAGDFERLGYFGGYVVSREPPRILLVAPALEFHSTIETLLGALAPPIDVTRIGLAADWRTGLRVMFRLRGNERPVF